MKLPFLGPKLLDISSFPVAQFIVCSPAAGLISFRFPLFICEMGVELHLQSWGEEKMKLFGPMGKSLSSGAYSGSWIQPTLVLGFLIANNRVHYSWFKQRGNLLQVVGQLTEFLEGPRNEA